MGALILAVLGFIGVLLGIGAIPGGKRLAHNVPSRRHYAIQRIIALAIGLVIAVAYFFYCEIIGYPLTIEGDRGFAMGIPFLAAYFDSQGCDYVGPFTRPAIVGNCVFWALLPHLCLVGTAYLKIRKKRESNKGVQAIGDKSPQPDP